jgi:hypothetical protein
MKLTLEPTDRMQTFDGAPTRVWKGVTESGVEVLAFIRCVQAQTHDEAKLAIFDQELIALPQPRKELVSFDYRMVAD